MRKLFAIDRNKGETINRVDPGCSCEWSSWSGVAKSQARLQGLHPVWESNPVLENQQTSRDVDCGAVLLPDIDIRN